MFIICFHFPDTVGLVSKDYSQTTSMTSSVSDFNSDLQLSPHAGRDTIDILSKNATFGNIKLQESSNNHIGTKIIAKNLTVVNNNNNSCLLYTSRCV